MKRLEEDFPTQAAGGSSPLIVHVVRQFLPNRGGLEDVVYNLCRYGLARGYRIRVVTLNSLFSAPDTVLAEREIIDGIEIVRIPWKGSSRYPVAPQVLKHIRDADFLHVHAVDFFYDFMALSRIVHGKRMIATTHGGFFHTRKFAAIKALWFKTLTRFSTSRYDFVVGCSHSDVETFGQIAHRNLRLIENGADTRKFHDVAAETPVKRIVTIGRFSSNKRLDRLVAMMRKLVAMDPEWTLEIIGVSSDLKPEDIMAFAGGIEAHVRVHHGLANTDIAKILSGSSFFASASEYEGFGLVAIEAMSAGLLPLLEGNSAFTILAGKHPQLRIANFADAEDAARSMVDAWNTLSGDPAGLRSQLIAAAEEYSWATVGERYIALYEAVAAKA